MLTNYGAYKKKYNITDPDWSSEEFVAEGEYKAWEDIKDNFVWKKPGEGPFRPFPNLTGILAPPDPEPWRKWNKTKRKSVCADIAKWADTIPLDKAAKEEAEYRRVIAENEKNKAIIKR